MQDKRTLQREIEKQKLELELQRHQLQLGQQTQELLHWDQNLVGLGGGTGAEMRTEVGARAVGARGDVNHGHERQ